MKLLVHDYCGHPFQVHLSRQLAIYGHDLAHVYFADNPGPKGMLAGRPGDPPSLRFVAITLPAMVSQTNLLARRFNDVTYGRRLAQLITDLKPDAVISSNTPTEAQDAILKTCTSRNIRFIYWLQDIYSVAVSKLVTKEFGIAGRIAGRYYKRMDRRHFRASDAIVAITDDFVPLVRSWAGETANISVIENWGVLEDINVGVKDNHWARQHGLNAGFTFLYSGTLGRKHNPGLLLRLAATFEASDARVVAVAQGVGVRCLQEAKSAQGLGSLTLLPLQPAEDLSNVLATADILVAMIEPDAGTFAVPSKVQSYLCAGRPILLAAPKENLASRTVTIARAGIVVDPSDEAGFLTAAHRLKEDPILRQELGANARAYAEATFDIRTIANRFEALLTTPSRRWSPASTLVSTHEHSRA